MTGSLLPNLKKYRALLSHQPDREEANLLRMVSTIVSGIRHWKGYSLDTFANRLGVDKELIIIVEIGEGDARNALHILRLACQLVVSDGNGRVGMSGVGAGK